MVKLVVEIEIEEGKIQQKLVDGTVALRGSHITSVKVNGVEVQGEMDSIGRNGGKFFHLPSPEKDDCFGLDLVEWE